MKESQYDTEIILLLCAMTYALHRELHDRAVDIVAGYLPRQCHDRYLSVERVFRADDREGTMKLVGI